MAHFSKSRVYFSRTPPLLPYSSIIFLICLGDAIMSYASPVYIQSFVSNPAIMGLIISVSSFIGFICDIIFAKIFSHKSSHFYLWLTIVIAAIFPASFLLFPPGLATFIFGMITWGIYFELLLFSNFNFINEYIPQTHYSGAWGTISSFKSTSYLLGPVISGFLLGLSSKINFSGPLVAYLIALFGFLIFYKSFSQKKAFENVSANDQLSRASLWQELVIWSKLFHKIWPVYLFLFSLSLVDATFWTLGTLISESLRSQHFWGAYFYRHTAYRD